MNIKKFKKNLDYLMYAPETLMLWLGIAVVVMLLLLFVVLQLWPRYPAFLYIWGIGFSLCLPQLWHFYTILTDKWSEESFDEAQQAWEKKHGCK